MPDLVKAPPPVILPDSELSPAPVKVKLVPLLAMPPVKASAAVAFVEVMVEVAPAAIFIALFKVSVVPAAVLSVMLAVPAKFRVLLLAKVPPAKFTPRVVPLASEIVPPVASPKALVLVTLRVPALNVVVPV